MLRIAVEAVITVGLLLFVVTPILGQAPVLGQQTMDYQVVTVADGLINPWSIAFLPEGDMLVTERSGRLRLVQGGVLRVQPIQGLPDIVAESQGGLLDIVLHPDFESNHWLYFSYTHLIGNGTETTTAVARGRLENDELIDVEDIFLAETHARSGHLATRFVECLLGFIWPRVLDAGSYGSRLAFDTDGYLFITVGDRKFPIGHRTILGIHIPFTGNLYAHPAQDLSNHHGVVVRLHDDGRIPADNPFVGIAGAHGAIWSYGHRNSQGLAFHPLTGDLWANEHGPQGGDELNVVLPGRNYGWSVIGYGVNYGSGQTIHEGTLKEGMESPKHLWVPSIATSGLMIYTGDQFPAWRGNIFVGGLGGEQLSRLTVDGQTVLHEEPLFQRMGRIRDVRQGPDGYIYLAIESSDGSPTSLVRLEPVGRGR